MFGKREFLKKTSELFDLPGEVVSGLPTIEITGFGRLRIENHRGILEYGDNSIDINGGSAIIRILGSGLEIRAMNSQALVIIGDIFGLEFKY